MSDDDSIHGYAELVQQMKEREQWILREQDLVENENEPDYVGIRLMKKLM